MSEAWRPSRRLPPAAVNAVGRAVAAARAAGVDFIDLTVSNPTTVGLPYPTDLLTPLSAASALRYHPEPFGLREAREAVAADFGRRGALVHPDQVVLCASTSEAYGWLFKLLCDPGDAVLVPRPSYPLFEHLTGLEGVQAVAYDLEYHRRWEVDFATVENAPPSTRAVLVVSPNNPTGSFLSPREVERLHAIARQRQWAIVCDEVFADYALDAVNPPTDQALDAEVLSFTLGGASKSLGLPQVKLGWIVVGGPDAVCREATAALEIIADTYLSVSTPVQVAAPSLLTRGGEVRRAIQERLRLNLQAMRSLVNAYPSCQLLRVEGGWSAVVRVPATRSEEQLVIELLDRSHVLVHPGYFFDFPSEAFLVVSLLPEPGIFVPACERMLRLAG
jgi:alanine-synthesizing transaminase